MANKAGYANSGDYGYAMVGGGETRARLQRKFAVQQAEKKKADEQAAALIASSVTFNTNDLYAGLASDLYPNGSLQSGYNVNLWEHELAGGHTIKLHVAKKISFLRNRVVTDPTTDVASSFFSLRHATALVNIVLNHHAAEVKEWMISPADKMAITSTFNKATGHSITLGKSRVKMVYNVLVLLNKPALTKEGFLIKTAWPY